MNITWKDGQPNATDGQPNDQHAIINGTHVVVRYDSWGRNWFAYATDRSITTKTYPTRIAAKNVIMDQLL